MRCLTICLIFALVGAERVSERTKMKKRLNNVLKSNPPHGAPNDNKGVPRIIGGDPATPGDYPWVVSLHYKGEYGCVASIYNKRTVITMASCVSHDPDQIKGRFFIRAGDHKLRAKDEHEQKVFVKHITMYPKFKESKFGNDVAVLKLDVSLEMNEFVQSIKIPESWKDEWLMKTDNCINVGWGWTTFPEGELAWVLNEVVAPIWSREKCWKFLNQYGVKLQNKHVCTLDPGHGSCIGDGGAPLVCYDAKDEPYLVGAAEFGDDDCRAGLAIHARLSKYKEWIEEVVG